VFEDVPGGAKSDEEVDLYLFLVKIIGGKMGSKGRKNVKKPKAAAKKAAPVTKKK
jgi:hypothetical protein